MATPQELRDDPRFPWTGELSCKPLDGPVVPEPARSGVTEAECHACARSDDSYAWSDDRWRLSGSDDIPLPGCVLLEPRAHHDSYADLPDDLAAEIGPMTGRVERAILSLGDVGRVHTVRWGDGGAHLHLWFLPRPLGALQLRGQALMFWIEVLPPIDPETRDRAHAAVAAAMSRDGGTAHVG